MNERNFSDRRIQLETTLLEIDATGSVPSSITTSPGAFLRNFYEIWLYNGGIISGRYNRNSLNRMTTEWLVGRHEVKSLHAKLSGKVKLSESDATSLIELFLERWKHSSQCESPEISTKDGYIAFPTKNIKALAKQILDAISRTNQNTKMNGFVIPPDSLSNIPTDERESRDEFTRQCLEADALITFSRHQILLGSNNSWKIKTFWEIVDEMYRRSTEEGDRDFLLIWIIDIGSRVLEDKSSFSCFHNAGLLAMHFIALASFQSDPTAKDRISLYKNMKPFDRSSRKDFWQWFKRKAFIIVQNLQEDEYLDYYGEIEKELSRTKFREIGTSSDQILPKSIPPNWSKKIRELYGRETKSLDDGTFTALVGKYNTKVQQSIKYYAHSQIDQETQKIRDDIIFRQTELLSPGANYDEAMEIVYLASRYVQNKELEIDSVKQSEEAAFGFLASHGYQTLSARDFVQIFWSGIDILDL